MTIKLFIRSFNILRKFRTKILYLFDFPSFPTNINQFSHFKFELSFKFWSFLCKRNKKLAKFYCNENLKTKKFNISDLTFDFNDLEITSDKNIDFPEIFYKTGIIVLKNFLSEKTKQDYL